MHYLTLYNVQCLVYFDLKNCLKLSHQKIFWFPSLQQIHYECSLYLCGYPKEKDGSLMEVEMTKKSDPTVTRSGI